MSPSDRNSFEMTMAISEYRRVEEALENFERVFIKGVPVTNSAEVAGNAFVLAGVDREVVPIIHKGLLRRHKAALDWLSHATKQAGDSDA